VDIQEVDVAARADDEQLLAIHEALDKLAVEDKVTAELVMLRYFVGLTIPEAAGRSTRARPC
jgi:ECF sigma factor